MKLIRNLDLTIGPTKEFLARQQRAMGRSLKDISKEFNIPVTSLRRLCDDIVLTNKQKSNLKHKKKKEIIVLNYKNENMEVTGKIKIKVNKKQLFNEQKLIDSIIEILSQNTLQTVYYQIERE